MQLLVYLLTYPILWVISKLPFILLYKVSDFLYIIFFHVVGYRKKLVLKNLTLCFPEKSHQELLTIRKKFYRHMCDLFLEMIKSLSMSHEEMERHAVFHNVEVLDKYAEQNKSVVLLCGHYGNYEWVLSLANHIKHEGFGIYSPLSNKYFDRLIKRIRKKNGGELISRYQTARKVLKNHRENRLSIYGFVNDQSPQLVHSDYWREFFGVKVPVFTAAETLAKKFDMAVVFFCVEKVKRGYYETTIIDIASNSAKYPDYQITDIYWEYLEREIRNKPEYYLWTHNRFKHKDKAPKKKVNPY